VGGQPFPSGLVPPGFNRNFQLLVSSTVSFRLVFYLTSAFPVSQGFGWRHERQSDAVRYRESAIAARFWVRTVINLPKSRR